MWQKAHPIKLTLLIASVFGVTILLFLGHQFEVVSNSSFVLFSIFEQDLAVCCMLALYVIMSV